jgi:hypothetical protein
MPRRKASFLQPALEFLMSTEVGIRPPAVHTIHDIGPFSAVAVPQAGIGDEFDLSTFPRGVARHRMDARWYGLRVDRMWEDFRHLAQGHA